MPPRIAIVGSGPSGCYVAQALLKLEARFGIDVIDRLPVPYGLVRYGVAADHQGTKTVTRQFERQGVHFFGNVTVSDRAVKARSPSPRYKRLMMRSFWHWDLVMTASSAFPGMTLPA